MLLLRQYSDTPCSSTMSVSPPTKRIDENTASRTKKVTFTRTCTVQLIPCLEDYTEDEIFSIWLDSISAEVIRKRCCSDIEKMRQGVPEDENNCYRGLEWKRPRNLKAKQLTRKRASVAVFLEQDRQWNDEVSKPGKIGAVYEKLTRHCREEAFRRALEDAKQACNDRHDRKPRRGPVSSAASGRIISSWRKHS
jgi:hypothetical protein